MRPHVHTGVWSPEVRQSLQATGGWNAGSTLRASAEAAVPLDVEDDPDIEPLLGHVLIVAPICLIGRGLEEIVRRACPSFRVTLVLSEASSLALPEEDAQLLIVYLDRSWPISRLSMQSRSSRTPVLLIYPQDDVEAALEALRCGFGGFFPVTEPAEMLIAAIHTLLAGNTFGPPSLLDHCLRRAANG